VIDGNHAAIGAGRIGHATTAVDVDGQGLLDEDVAPGVECLDREIGVGRWRRGDHHHVDGVTREQVVEISRRASAGYVVSEVAGQLKVGVGDGYEARAGNVTDRRGDERAERAASDEAELVDVRTVCHTTVRSSSATPMRASAMP